MATPSGHPGYAQDRGGALRRVGRRRLAARQGDCSLSASFPGFAIVPIRAAGTWVPRCLRAGCASTPSIAGVARGPASGPGPGCEWNAGRAGGTQDWCWLPAFHSPVRSGGPSMTPAVACQSVPPQPEPPRWWAETAEWRHAYEGDRRRPGEVIRPLCDPTIEVAVAVPPPGMYAPECARCDEVWRVAAGIELRSEHLPSAEMPPVTMAAPRADGCTPPSAAPLRGRTAASHWSRSVRRVR